MAINYKEVPLIPSGEEGSARRALEAPHPLLMDVRLSVESQFRQMEKAHDRIRAEELAARLPVNAIN